MTTALDFGWWQFAPTPEGGRMEHVHTGEAIVAGAPLAGAERELAEAAHPGRPDLAWRRFHYEHSELRATLAVGMAEDGGLAVVDYNVSARLSGEARPAYGRWVRVDDAVLEAFRIWPGARTSDDPPGKLRTVGGWFNGKWEPRLVRAAIMFPRDFYEKARKAQFRFPEPCDLLQSLDLSQRRWVVQGDGRLKVPDAPDEYFYFGVPGGADRPDELIGGVVFNHQSSLVFYRVNHKSAQNGSPEEIFANPYALRRAGKWAGDDIASRHQMMFASLGDVGSAGSNEANSGFQRPFRLPRLALQPSAVREVWRENVTAFLVAPLSGDPGSRIGSSLPVPGRVFLIINAFWIGDWLPYEPIYRGYLYHEYPHEFLTFPSAFFDCHLYTWIG